MENRTDSDRLIHEIAASRRVLALGGLAVISHGLGRNTHDADIWVEPMESPEVWASVVGPLVYSTPSAKPVAIAVWEPIPEKNLAEVIARDGVFRINGLDPQSTFSESPTSPRSRNSSRLGCAQNLSMMAPGCLMRSIS